MVKKTAKLIHKNKLILSDMKYADSILEISRGLMMSGKKKIKKGIFLVMPGSKNVKFGASVTMLFCFYDLEVLFINTDFEVVDKKILKTWNPSYTPKKPAKFIIEGEVGEFKNINIGDIIKIVMNK